MRILIVHPGLGAGGSEARALVLIEALAADHAVTLLTGAVPEWQRLNAAYDTAIDPGCLTLAVAPMPARLRAADGGDALRGAFVDRAARRMAGALTISNPALTSASLAMSPAFLPVPTAQFWA